MSANDKQVGGSHYQTEDGIPQHWDIAIALNWDFMIYAATKYLWRLGKKGGPEKELEDLQKAIHYLEKKQELLRAKLAQGIPGEPAQKHRTPPLPGAGSWEHIGIPGLGVRVTGHDAAFDVPEHDGGPTRGYVDQD